MLTTQDLDLLTTALVAESKGTSLTPAQRFALRHICAGLDYHATPEHLLVEFKLDLVCAADGACIAHGSDRNELIAKLVSGFIDELYTQRSQNGFHALPPTDGMSAGAP